MTSSTFWRPKAIPLAPDWRLERKAIDYFRRKGVIVEPRPGHYFMRPDKLGEWRAAIRKRAAFALAFVAAAAAAVLAING